ERRLDGLARADVARDGHERGPALPDRPAAMELRPKPRLLAADELHLDRLRELLAGEKRVDTFPHRLAIRRPEQVGHRLADQRARIDTEKLAGGTIRMKNGT